MVSCILLFCVLYSIRYTFYERQYKKAAIFSKNVRDTAFFMRTVCCGVRIEYCG